MTHIIETQNNETAENRGEEMILLYEAIRERISQSFFSRRQIDEDELLHVLFMELLEKEIPAYGSEELEDFLQRRIDNAIREFRRAVRAVEDIDELDPDLGPAYLQDAHAEEAEFEEHYARFCNTLPQPQRTVFARCRTHTRSDLALLAGVPVREIYEMLASLPKEFELFLKKIRE